MPLVNNNIFLDVLRQTKLLSQDQLDLVLAKVPGRFADARSMARVMLKEDWLTVYQINQLLSGNGNELVIGPYQILDRLGAGGQSTVYKAKHREGGWIVALKVIRAELLGNAEASNQFMQEMESMACLNHPNVVQLFDADRVGDTYYCALEYIEGTDIGKYVRLTGPLPASEACDYIRQAALGLQHAHEHNLIHRDIKPGNLYLTGESTKTNNKVGSLVKILDWGLSSLRPPKSENNNEGNQNGTKHIIGTADYVSPEQIINPDLVDIRGDIYSLGCTLYFLLTGKPPFPKGTLMQKILQHQNEEPFPVDSVRPDLPLGLASTLKRMMAKKPENRYQTPASVALALKPFCNSNRFLLPPLHREARHRLGLEKPYEEPTAPKESCSPEEHSNPTLVNHGKGDTRPIHLDRKKK